VMVMQGGRVVEQGSRDDVFDRPRADYTKQLLRAVPTLPSFKSPPSDALGAPQSSPAIRS
jgi:peptide/nickel transport system ATP-binding protein